MRSTTLSRALRTLTAATVGVLALAGSTVATAAPAPASRPQAVRAPALVCTVNDNGVNYRGGPGPEYPVLGQVNRGQNLDYRGRTGDWIMGDLWGGTTGVWIYVAYLDC
ncbi:SH3 domain-containing protein [Streptomyces beijiangensis]|uniref:SH3 domain-containing protein n=1 Tax=Streptomyces beijiangensis TaxID=163361 RepID=A0A939F550_9ACTN|nr:SH3 domain-containing protein [Streptomyces beijiangensis]MBO0512751.1 SH3 domain-containing protein [Streptomyces beijiangensis]